jgi:hypothetical protein
MMYGRVARARFIGRRARSRLLVAQTRERDLADVRIVEAGSRAFGFGARGTEVDQIVMLALVVHDPSPSLSWP